MQEIPPPPSEAPPPPPVLEFPAPNPLVGDLLEEELADAGFPTRVGVVPGDPSTTADDVIRLANLTEDDRAAVAPIIAAHTGTAQFQVDTLNTERNNKSTIVADALAAMAANRQDIADNLAWRAANPTAAPVLRALEQQSTRQARQLNGLIRLLLERFDGTD
jgi:hypothetical protein